MKKEENHDIPVMLVKTWVTLARNHESEYLEAKNRALFMLKTKIGSTEDIANYMKKHNIK
jgi:hypothetical protein